MILLASLFLEIAKTKLLKLKRIVTNIIQDKQFKRKDKQDQHFVVQYRIYSGTSNV